MTCAAGDGPAAVLGRVNLKKRANDGLWHKVHQPDVYKSL